MSEISFTPITWREDSEPAIDAINLNRIEDCLTQLVERANTADVKVLWSGALWMGSSAESEHGVQEAPLSEPISAQKHGIVLHFSGWDIANNKPLDNDNVYVFVPKNHLFGQGVQSSWFVNSALVTKCLYCSDNVILGYSGNDADEGSYAGVTRRNRQAVLREVIAV